MSDSGKLAQDFNDSVRSMTIPPIGHLTRRNVPFQNLARMMQDFLTIVANDDVRAHLAGDGPLGIVAKC